ncbi:hypothetical protein DCM91_05065 [Chitinophaga costaii]|nr:hypothetical protein DCM91_05065 [Chitinophaga costaii]
MEPLASLPAVFIFQERVFADKANACKKNRQPGTLKITMAFTVWEVLLPFLKLNAAMMRPAMPSRVSKYPAHVFPCFLLLV